MLLGWTAVDDAQFYVRQFCDMKVIPDSSGSDRTSETSRSPVEAVWPGPTPAAATRSQLRRTSGVARRTGMG
ncbi:hypothetical protein [Candidatus Microthrix sp.]|uniref:hypothetical protein n=1 Tax=Candidatus Neomicrothrix sp. TaxID=2719034 RepID=UPI0032C23196